MDGNLIMGNIRLYGSTSGYTELAPPAVAPDGVLSLPSGVGTLLTAEGGKVLQVVSTLKQDTFTTASTSYTDVTGLTATITPANAANKILVIVSLPLGNAGAFFTRGAILRTSTIVGGGTPAGDRPAGSFFILPPSTSAGFFTQSMTFLDDPATTSATTYKVQIATESGGTGYVNISFSGDVDDVRIPRLASSITLVEVSA